MCTEFWWGNLRERDHWGDPDVDGRIILRWIFRKWEGVVGRKLLPSYRTRSATLPRSEPLPTTTTGHHTICCKKNVSLALLKMGKSLPETC